MLASQRRVLPSTRSDLWLCCGATSVTSPFIHGLHATNVVMSAVERQFAAGMRRMLHTAGFKSPQFAGGRSRTADNVFFYFFFITFQEFERETVRLFKCFHIDASLKENAFISAKCFKMDKAQ